jgi:dUTP pyrophosphatase
MSLQLNYYKLFPDVPDLTFATDQSACFDLRVYIKPGLSVSFYNQQHLPFHLEHTSNSAILQPGVTYLLHSGIIFDIPEGYSVRVHPRSSMAGKRGIINPNLEGVIDSDYVEECLMLLKNTSKYEQVLNDGDRVLQAELVPVLKYGLVSVTNKPVRRTNRIGGFGSTGIN